MGVLLIAVSGMLALETGKAAFAGNSGHALIDFRNVKGLADLILQLILKSGSHVRVCPLDGHKLWNRHLGNT